MEPAKKANALVPATRRLIRHVVDFGVRAIDLLFPPRCLHCDAELPAQRQPSLLCEPCCLLFGPEAWLGCRRCGALQAVESCQDYGDCLNCHDRTFHFQRVIPLGAYEDALREAVLKAKRPAYEHLATALGHLFFQRRQRELREFRPDLIVPIPMFWLRRLHRQVNSAQTIARTLAASLHLPAVGSLLVRVRNTFPQKDLSPEERARNVRGAFQVPPRRRRKVQGSRVLLVDDILTTGATCSEAAWVLKQAGAVAVVAAVLARA